MKEVLTPSHSPTQPLAVQPQTYEDGRDHRERDRDREGDNLEARADHGE